ncbi:MAG: hypothetical protein JWQ32_3019 [Marmoricola sp.]|nr:hypothetical protein [Marmoricola sp.]
MPPTKVETALSVVATTFDDVTIAPDIVNRYYAASSAGDLDTLVACFVPDAHVIDEGQSYHGVAEIRAWRESLASRFTYTLDITGVERTGEDAYVVSTHLEGDFPGGVVDLDQRFSLVDGLISALRI